MKEVQERDYPQIRPYSLTELERIFYQRQQICLRYNIHVQAFDLWLKIVVKWNNEHIGSSVYSLSGSTGKITQNGIMIRKLIEKDLLVVCGYGKFGCNLYCPTPKAMEVLAPLVDLTA